MNIDILALSPSRRISVLCDKLILATGLTSEPNMPSIDGLDWADGSTPHNIHARDVGKYCRNHLAYQPIPKNKRPRGKKKENIHIEETRKSQPLRSVAIYGANKSFRLCPLVCNAASKPIASASECCTLRSYPSPLDRP